MSDRDETEGTDRPGEAATHVLDQVYAVVRQRQAAGGSESYVATLTARGLPKVRSKVLEEAGELLEASVRLEAAGRPATAAASEAGATSAGQGGVPANAERRADADHEAMVHEAADLLFHALVLLGAHDVPVEDVWAELRRRFGVGGLVEKSARSKKQP